jgi:hypothetical protein
MHTFSANWPPPLFRQPERDDLAAFNLGLPKLQLAVGLLKWVVAASTATVLLPAARWVPVRHVLSRQGWKAEVAKQAIERLVTSWIEYVH